MVLNEFLLKSQFSQQGELRRALLIAFYNSSNTNISTFTVKDLSDWLAQLGYARPNQARLKTNIRKSRMFVAAEGETFRIHPSTLETLGSEFPGLSKKSDEVIAHDSVLPESLLQKDRVFIKALIKQINASFENNIFDGCAVLMRRLLEVLLILSYEAKGISSQIQDAAGTYKMLNAIIDDAERNHQLGLSRSTRECLDIFRKLGNFSAHKIYYNANRKAIESVILDFKATIEELLYKSELRT